MDNGDWRKEKHTNMSRLPPAGPTSNAHPLPPRLATGEIL